MASRALFTPWSKWLLALATLAATACKVPISQLNAEFSLADASWFEEEETLFVFYQVQAEHELGAESVVELRYTTDDGVTRWQELSSLPQVHRHLAVDCGARTLCGSGSLHVPLEPREVHLRLRYHRDGELALLPTTAFNVVGPGAPHTSRSVLIYGVFDKHNRALQWCARHVFPTVRNEQAERLGLRRWFKVEAQWGDDTVEPRAQASSVADIPGALGLGGDSEALDPGASGGPGSLFPLGGTPATAKDDNPYRYGVDCVAPETTLELVPPESDERAVFNEEDLPSAASAATRICAEAVVQTAIGPFKTIAVARKNPEVRPAFPVLRSPIQEATQIKYLLSVCERTISAKHLAMQRQRLQLEDVVPICIDDWNETLSDALVERLASDLERVRAEGHDMVLSIALHHDTPGLRAEVEEALALVLAPERQRTTPRLAGAFVFDSVPFAVDDATVGQTTLWCPASIVPSTGSGGAGAMDGAAGGGGTGGAGSEETSPLQGNTSIASLACVVVPDTSLSLGPFSIAGLPILPSRTQYLKFLETYSDDEAGHVESLAFLTPELPPTSDAVPIPPIGMASFLNDESIEAIATDAFSFCGSAGEYQGFVFRSATSPQPVPLAALPAWHNALSETSYDLGLVWEFPFLLRLEYETAIAAAVSAFSVSVPFGYPIDSAQEFGSSLWLSNTFPLAESLTQCRRFCDHPAFDSAGVYQVGAGFRTLYANNCYKPRYPERGDSGFPSDP